MIARAQRASRNVALALVLLMACTAAACAAADPVYDVKALSSTPLKPRVLKTEEKDGIVTEEVMFHSEMDGSKSVDIFALFSYPKGARALPAFVWNQGGLYRATTYWTEFGAKRGYATLCIDFPIGGYRSTGGYPINSGLALTPDLRKAPIYHGAVALLKAVSYLESRPEVDSDRIGMAGSSWGGFYTTMMVGLDPRLKAGACMFGCGALHLGNNWWSAPGPGSRVDAAYRERWRTTLDPALRLPNTKTPIAWFTGTNDGFYWMPALMESHRLAAGPKCLSLLANWNHGLTETGDEQVFAWLDAQLKDGKALNTVSPLEVAKVGGALQAHWTVAGPRPVKRAELLLSYGEAGNWTARYWGALEAKLAEGKCTAALPASPMPFYVSGTAVDEQGFRYSTPLVRVDPEALGAADPAAKLDCDGCAMWGGFEKEQLVYLRRTGWPCPAASADARAGKQAAQLKPGANRLAGVYFTAGVPHRLTCWLKAKAPVEVKLTLAGSFDGKPKVEERTVKVGTEWTEASVEFTPPQAQRASLGLTVNVPQGAEVLLDCVEFRPKGK